MKLKYLGKQLLDIPVTGRYSRTGNGSIPDIFSKLATTKSINNRSKVTTSRPNPKNYGFGKMGGWNRKIGEGNISDLESLRMLLEMGLSGSARDIQQKINEKFGANSVKVDNKWGNQSRTGLKALYDEWKNVKGPAPTLVVESVLDEAYLILKPSNQVIALPKIEMPYRSTGTYDLDKSRTLKNLGIRDYNSLVNYVNTNPGSSIASDLKQRFGETSTWNQQDFENQIGIGGHYGRMNRNALWGYLNGLKLNYNNKYLQQLGYMTLMRKKGGQLVSKNPVKRFKNRK